MSRDQLALSLTLGIFRTGKGNIKGKGGGEGQSVWKHNCIDDHAAIIHPLLLLVLFNKHKK